MTRGGRGRARGNSPVVRGTRGARGGGRKHQGAGKLDFQSMFDTPDPNTRHYPDVEPVKEPGLCLLGGFVGVKEIHSSSIFHRKFVIRPLVCMAVWLRNLPTVFMKI